MKRLRLTILILISLFAISSCKKETIILPPSSETVSPSPSIEIVSIDTTGLTSFEITVEIRKGTGQSVKGANIIMEDITVRSDENITLEIALDSNQNQTISKAINTGRLSHDFIVEATLKTSQGIYTSGKRILRSIKNNYYSWFLTDELYAIPDENIALTLNPGDKFSIIVDYKNTYVPNSVLVKLSENYTLESSFSFESGIQYPDHISSFGSATVPQSIPPGDYTVDLYIEGQHCSCPMKIRILKGSWTSYEENYPGEKRGEYAWFVLQDRLFIVGGSFYVTALNFSPVWEYDLTHKLWTRKNNFLHLTEDPDWIISTNILPYNLQYMDNGYILVRSFQNLDLWKYSQPDDHWNKVAKYPGIGENYVVAFILSGYLYIGGGVDGSDPTAFEPARTTEFYRLNLNSLKWEKINDIPSSLTGTIYFPTCTFNDKAYCLEPDRTLWEYDPMTDKWHQKQRFIGPWRVSSKLVSNNAGIFLLGGEYLSSVTFNTTPALKDCWKYEPEKDNWEQKAFLPCYISRGIAFSYKGHIYTGLGYTVESSYDYNNNNQYIYRFSQD